MEHDKYKSCEGCPDRVVEPRCHDTCPGNLYRIEKRAEFNKERRKKVEYNEAKQNAIDYTRRASKHGYLKVRRSK